MQRLGVEGLICFGGDGTLVDPSFYDSERLGLSRVGIDYLLPIFNNALGSDDLEHVRQSLLRRSNLAEPYHSANVDINKRICHLD
jgi:hypothetical protein